MGHPALDSNSEKVEIYIRLLDEGTEVSRPTTAFNLGDGLFEILPIEGYDPEDEKWEYPPGSVVRAKVIETNERTYLLAVHS